MIALFLILWSLYSHSRLIALFLILRKWSLYFLSCDRFILYRRFCVWTFSYLPLQSDFFSLVSHSRGKKNWNRRRKPCPDTWGRTAKFRLETHFFAFDVQFAHSVLLARGKLPIFFWNYYHYVYTYAYRCMRLYIYTYIHMRVYILYIFGCITFWRLKRSSRMQFCLREGNCQKIINNSIIMRWNILKRTFLRLMCSSRMRVCSREESFKKQMYMRLCVCVFVCVLRLMHSSRMRSCSREGSCQYIYMHMYM